jgi:hypothetical protein
MTMKTRVTSPRGQEERTSKHKLQTPSSGRKFQGLSAQNVRFARRLWRGQLSGKAFEKLQKLTAEFGLRLSLGELTYLESGWYVTHVGLLALAHRRGCSGIQVKLINEFCDPSQDRWVFEATVFPRNCVRGFIGYGDADPSNTSPLVRGAEMRVAETRAVNRALRKAYGIGLCSVEELGSFSAPPKPFVSTPASNSHAGSNGSRNGQPRLRDRLCLLIRHHNLDPALVKAYAADFCGTTTLKDASRDLVESFITQLAASAEKDRDALVCKLNSYAQPVEAKP